MSGESFARRRPPAALVTQFSLRSSASAVGADRVPPLPSPPPHHPSSSLRNGQGTARPSPRHSYSSRLCLEVSRGPCLACRIPARRVRAARLAFRRRSYVRPMWYLPGTQSEILKGPDRKTHECWMICWVAGSSGALEEAPAREERGSRTSVATRRGGDGRERRGGAVRRRGQRALRSVSMAESISFLR